MIVVNSLLSATLWIVPWLLLPYLPKIRLKALTALIIALCSVSFSFGLLELALRMGAFFNDPTWVPQEFVALGNERAAQARVEAALHPLHFRDNTVSRLKAPGTVRVAILGDSFVWGTGLVDSDRWTRILERELKKQYNNLEVLHWGKEAWSTKTHFEFLKKHAKDWSIDYAILCFISNDTDVGVYPQWELNLGYGSNQDRLHFIGAIFPNVANFIGGHLRHIIEAYDIRYGYVNWQAKLWSVENLVRFRSMVSAFHGYLTDERIPAVVLLIPERINSFYKTKFEVAEPIFNDAGFETYNLFPELAALVEQVPKELMHAHRGDPHPGPGITKIYAELVRRYLERDGKFQQLMTDPSHRILSQPL